MTLRALFKVSPLGCVGMFLLGGVFAAQFGMAAVYGARTGLSIPEISMFVTAFYLGATVLQFPLGWLSDRMDRRMLILLASAMGGAGALLGMAAGTSFPVLLVAAFLVGGTSNPLYSLLIAYTNDFLDRDDMASASGGMLFINGLGAIAGPLITGWMMGMFGSPGYFLLIAILMIALALYAGYRMTQRRAPPISETATYTPISPTATSVALDVAREHAINTAESGQDRTKSA